MGEGEIWPPPPKQKPLNRWSPKFVQVTTSGTYTTVQNFYLNRFRGFGSAHAWFRAPKITQVFFLFLRKATAETRAPILTQNTSNDTVRRKEVLFGGRETKIESFDPHFPQKTAIFGPNFDGT